MLLKINNRQCSLAGVIPKSETRKRAISPMLPAGRKTFMIVSALALFLAMTEDGFAAACGIPSIGTDTVVTRQLSALRMMAQRRGCKQGDQHLGGFFNACRDLALQIAKLEGAGPRNPKPGGCDQKTRVRPTVKGEPRTSSIKAPSNDGPAQARESDRSDRRGRGMHITYCVRLSDGYLFPAPNSQFDRSGDTRETLARCQHICKTDAVDLYVLTDSNDETADMVSVRTGAPYAELSTAYDYHGAAQFKKCDWAGYVRTMSRLRLERGAAGMKDVIAPLPTSRPSVVPQMAESGGHFTASPAPEIRVVGASFIYDEEEEGGGAAPYRGTTPPSNPATGGGG